MNDQTPPQPADGPQKDWQLPQGPRPTKQGGQGRKKRTPAAAQLTALNNAVIANLPPPVLPMVGAGPANGVAESDVIARRRRLMAIRLSGVSSVTAAAEFLGVSKTTISQDWGELDEQWRAENAEALAMEKDIHIQQVKALLAAHWPAALAGDALAAGVVIQALREKAKIFGLYAPARVDITHEVIEVAQRYGVPADEAITIAMQMAGDLGILARRDRRAG